MISAMRLEPGTAPPSGRNPRILYIIDSIYGMGGAEMSLVRLVRELHGSGFECAVVTFHTNQNGRGVLSQFPCPVYHWPIENVYGARAFATALRLHKLVRELKTDIVHTFFQTADLWAGPIAKLSGARVLISSRRDMGILRRRKDRIAYRLLRRCFDQVQAVSESVRQFTIDADGVPAERTVTIHNGIDAHLEVDVAEVQRARAAHHLRAGIPVIACVANFRPVKGLDVLVRALALVSRRCDAWQAIVAGLPGGHPVDRAYGESVLRLAGELGVADSIQFAGYTTDVPAILAASDIFVLPSRSEGLSNALLEAMRAGLPCLATAVGGNSEVVVDNETGFLVPSEDPVALACRIQALLENPERRWAMGRAGRARLLAHFTLEAMITRVKTQYYAALGKQRDWASEWTEHMANQPTEGSPRAR